MASTRGSGERSTNSESNSGRESMAAFSVVRKKTPFQKHREEEEAKKKRADEEAARLYEEFVESFKADDTPGSKTFVRGGVINPDNNSKQSSEGNASREHSTSKKAGSRYVPSFMPPGLAAIVNKEKESDKKKVEEKPKEKERKTRQIEEYAQEIKRGLERREKSNPKSSNSSSAAATTRFDELPDDLPGSFDDGDPQTTNLYVGNLSPQVDENFLLRTFGRFGPVASVKIMWPRSEEERRRHRNCGFVAFMNRAEAQAAKDEMQGVVVYEYDLRIGWGKAVALPAQALPAPPPGQMAIRSKEGGSAANVAWSGPGAPPAVTAQNTEVVLTPNVPDIQVVPPSDDHLRRTIDTMAMYVLDDGCAFEQAIMERGRGNPLFNFLFDLGSPEHTYYVWRLYSFAQGDTLQRWRTEPFIMVTGSGRWVPPSLPQSDASRSPDQERGSTFAAGKAKREVQDHALTDSQLTEFEEMLRALTLERSLIRDAMGFALDNAEYCDEIVEIVTESLTIRTTPIPTKVARLMLVNDILHNSSAPVKNASAYRTAFEYYLPDIMESFNDLYRNITGRITAEALKERVLKVLQVWTDWFLFTDAFVNGLRATFLRSGNSGVPSFHAICGDTPWSPPTEESERDENRDHDSVREICQGAAAQEWLRLPLSELERRCRHSGLSTRGGRDIMVARLCSLAEPDRRRFPVPDMAALQPRTSSSLNNNETAPSQATKQGNFPGSNYIREDEEDRHATAVNDERSQRENATSVEDDRRQKLRRVEAASLEYRESLEKRGLRSEEIDRKVSQHRKQLEIDDGLQGGSDRRDRRDSSSSSSRKRTRSRSRSPHGRRERQSGWDKRSCR